MDITTISHATSATATDSQSSSAGKTSGTNALANEQTFLKLFVSQLKNQDPLNPMDGAQFVTQLAQFSQLEQSLQMRTDLDNIAQDLSPVSSGTTPSTTAP